MKNIPQIITSRKFNSLQSADRYAIIVGDETIADNLPSLETLRPNRKSMTLTPFVDDADQFIGVYFKIGDAQGNVVFEGTKCIIDDYNEFFTEDMTNRILSASKRYLGLTKIRKFTAERIRNSYYNNGIQFLHYANRSVDIRPKGKKFIVWDMETDQIFANELFNTIAEAEQFIADNKMERTEAW